MLFEALRKIVNYIENQSTQLCSKTMNVLISRNQNVTSRNAVLLKTVHYNFDGMKSCYENSKFYKQSTRTS